jgi:hypothetical protein
MWIELGRSLGIELEYLFATMAEAALPDPLWQPEEPSNPIIQESSPPSQH